MKKRSYLLLILFVCSVSLLHAEIITGECGENGDNVTYTWDTETGVLEISGIGNMKDWGFYTPSFFDRGIKTLRINDGVTSVGAYAFTDCTSLTNIIFPGTVTNIGERAFKDGCSALKDVYCYAKEIPTTYYNQVFDNLSQATLHVNASVLEKYKNTAPWAQFSRIVPIDGEDTKVVDCRSANVVITDIYDESGRRRERLGSGINIIRMSDGTVRKVLVRIGN